MHDLRLAIRAVRRQPAFAFASIGTFALGIGAATAIFCVAYGVTFRPLSYPAAERLVRIYEAHASATDPKHLVSQGTFQGWREGIAALEGLALYGPVSTQYLEGDPPTPVRYQSVSPQLFEVLGVRPLLGRGFKPESEYTRFTAGEVVISFEAWQRLFGGDPAVVGKTLPLVGRDKPPPIVGVMPRAFSFQERVEIWQPEIVEVPVAGVVRTSREDQVVARLRHGQTIDDLRAELDVVSTRLAREYPASNTGWTATTESLHEAIVGQFGRASWLLLAAVGALLLVACANVAGLLSARAMMRAREASIRLAIGARRRDLARLWLSETSVLALVGGTLGVVLAWWLVALLRAVAPPGLPRVEDIALDALPLGMAGAATLVAATLCGVAPLLGAPQSRHNARVHADGVRAGHTPDRRRVSIALVALQCGAAIVLTALAVLFVRSFLNLTAVDLGWTPKGVLSLDVKPRIPPEVRRPWFLYTQWADRLVDRLQAVPGIERAAVVTSVPFTGQHIPATLLVGRDRVGEEARWPVGLEIVSDGYFATLGIEVSRGRAFTREDRFSEPVLVRHASALPGVAIVTESIAQQLWPGRDAIGQAIRLPGFDLAAYRQVIGVTADVRFTSVTGAGDRRVFLPWAQQPTGVPRLLVRTRGEPASFAAVVRAAVLEENPATGIDRVSDVERYVERDLAAARVTTQLTTLLAVLVLILAAVGTYGSSAMFVHAETRETAVRIALGASVADTLRRTIARGLAPVLGGIAIGIVLTLLVSTAVRSLLFGVDAVNVWSLSLSTSVVLILAIVACVPPALRAARTDPIVALRAE
jgi:predicted permease